MFHEVLKEKDSSVYPSRAVDRSHSVIFVPALLFLNPLLIVVEELKEREGKVRVSLTRDKGSGKLVNYLILPFILLSFELDVFSNLILSLFVIRLGDAVLHDFFVNLASLLFLEVRESGVTHSQWKQY